MKSEFSSSTSSTVLGVRRLMLPTAWSLFFQPKRKNDSPNAYAFPLDGLKVACYYGCALLRPTEVCNFDDDEQPHTMEDLVALSGASPIEWNFKNECCGASHQ